MAEKIQVLQVNKQFKNEMVLHDINIKFEEGKIHGIIGKNGSGKTVLLKIICGLLKPTSGKVLVDGKEVGKDIDYPDNMGIIIEAPGFLPYSSGYKNLEYLASLKKIIGKEDIERAMRKVGLDPAIKKGVGKYSLGLGLAQAIMENPDILILDEPMNGLDKQGVEEMRSLFSELRDQGKTILLVSHSGEDISSLCDTVCEMDRGNLTQLSV